MLKAFMRNYKQMDVSSTRDTLIISLQHELISYDKATSNIIRFIIRDKYDINILNV